VAESEQFLHLENHQVEEWICSDEIAVSTEDEIFKIIIKWIKQNKGEREEKFEELFRHMRLAHMSHDYFHGDVVTNNFVKKNPSCLKLVEDAVNGIYRSELPRKGTDSHFVVFAGKETFCCQPKEDRWDRLADAPLYDHHHFEENCTSFQVHPRLTIQ